MRTGVALFSLGAVLAGLPAAQAAQAYPDRPLRMMVPFAPGGGSDIVGRILAEGRHQALGQPVEPIPSTTAEFSAYLKPETEKWGKVVRASGIKPL